MRIGVKGLAPLLAVVMLAGPAFGQGQGTGDEIDDFHGNATNERPSGNGVTPSLAPGPWACGGADCSVDTTGGSSIGDFAGQGGADFANGEEDGPNFSEPYDHDGVFHDTGEP